MKGTGKALPPVLKKAFSGALVGLTYYLVYAVLLPQVFSTLLKTPIEAGYVTSFIALFIALGTAESVLRSHPISIPLRVISKLLGALILYVVLNGGHLEVEVPAEGVVIHAELDVSPLLHAVILFSLLYGFIDAFSYYTTRNAT